MHNDAFYSIVIRDACLPTSGKVKGIEGPGHQFNCSSHAMKYCICQVKPNTRCQDTRFSIHQRSVHLNSVSFLPKSNNLIGSP